MNPLISELKERGLIACTKCVHNKFRWYCTHKKSFISHPRSNGCGNAERKPLKFK